MTSWSSSQAGSCRFFPRTAKSTLACTAQSWPSGYRKHWPKQVLQLAIQTMRTGAGSLSISELNINGLPSILVQFPFAAADHQRHNAISMEKSGAALFLEDAKCTGASLLNCIF